MATTVVIITLAFLVLVALAAILNTQKKILGELKNIRIPEPPPPPKIEFPNIEIPPAKEVVLDLSPVVEAVKNIPSAKEVAVDLNPVVEAIDKISPLASVSAELLQVLQETSTLMRVNQAEFQSGLEAFHKAIDKLLTQIPSGEKELDVQKEFMQKFEEAFVKVQETAAENMNANSLRLQEILTEVLKK